jgi:hypothetical protein
VLYRVKTENAGEMRDRGTLEIAVARNFRPEGDEQLE